MVPSAICQVWTDGPGPPAHDRSDDPALKGNGRSRHRTAERPIGQKQPHHHAPDTLTDSARCRTSRRSRRPW